MSNPETRSDTPSSVTNNSINNVLPPRIAPRCVTGSCHPANRKSLDWSESCGLIAYGNHGTVVVVDAVSLQVVQCLDNEHRSSVVKVAWTKTNCASKHLADRMTLASSDATGKILVWNVKSGEVKARMQDSSCSGPIYAFTWMDGRIENTGHLILALHPPFNLILWDTSLGTKVWKKTYDSVLINFELDPFDANRIALRCADGIILVNDFQPGSNSNPPSGQGRRLHLLSPSSPTIYGAGSQGNSPRASNSSFSSIGNDGYIDSPPTDKGKATRARIKSMVKELVTGEVQNTGGDTLNGKFGSSLPFSECVQVLFNRAVRNHLFLVYPREIYIVDLEIGQTVGCIGGSNFGNLVGERLSNSLTPIFHVHTCSQRDALYILHENGTISFRTRRGDFSKISNSRSGLSSLSRSISMSSSLILSSEGSKSKTEKFNQSIDSSNIGASRDDDSYEICYDIRGITCDSAVRLAGGAKGSKVLGMICNPISECQLLVLTSDGRSTLIDIDVINNNNSPEVDASDTKVSRPMICLEDMIPGTMDNILTSPLDEDMCNGTIYNQLKLQTTGILGGLLPPPFVVRMCPPLTVKNFSDYRPLIAIGAMNGSMQILDVATGRIVREFATHTYQVQGLEWTSLNSILSFGYQNLSGSTGGNHAGTSDSRNSSNSGSSSFVRNELMHTDIRTGKSRSLRAHRTEEPPIDMVRVSHLKQYFIVAFIGAPFELWDLRSLTLLRTMPKKFPPITALDWSPLHNLKHLKRKEREKLEKEQREKEQESTGSKNDPKASPSNKFDDSADTKASGNDENVSPNSNTNSKNEQTVDNNVTQLVAKEHFVFTDPEGQLYHFSVEGNTIRDGTKIAAESGLGNPVTFIAWKSDHVVRSDVDGNINVWDVKGKASRNLTSSQRGPIKKVRFAPGRGNLKLLVLQRDAVSIWDIKDCELISEIQAPKDIVSRPVDIDWAASDRPVIATADGCIRILSLQLTSSTSPMMDYERKETGNNGKFKVDDDDEFCISKTVACHSLMQNKARNNFQVILHHQPWKRDLIDDSLSGEDEENNTKSSQHSSRYDLHFDEKDGFSPSEVEFFKEQISTMDKSMKDYITNPDVTPTERCLMVAQYCGLSWEADFWRVLYAVVSKQNNMIFPKEDKLNRNITNTEDPCVSNSLDLKFDLACNNNAYANYQKRKLNLHESKCRYDNISKKNGPNLDIDAMRMRRSNVVDKMLCLGMKDKAIKMLLESTAATDPSDPTFYEYNLRACLVATCQAPRNSSSELDGSNSTTKLVATNLISEGKLWEGIQLLCLIGKYVDACQYLQSSGEWDASVWLSKCRLSVTEDANEMKGLEKIIDKYCDYTSGIRGQKKKAILIQLSSIITDESNQFKKDKEEIGNVFVGILDSLLAAKMVGLAGRLLYVCQEQLKGIIPDTSHAMVVCEEVNLAYARYLFFDCGNANAAFYYCKKADEKGEILEREIQTLISGSNDLGSSEQNITTIKDTT